MAIAAEDLLDALDSVTWYNCLAEHIRRWKEPGYLTERMGSLMLPYCLPGVRNGRDQYQLEVFWMICVVLFGNYGTSPRSGWIDDKKGFYHFIDDITYTYMEPHEGNVEP